MSRYAQNTSVSTEKSQREIKETLMRYGADEFGMMENRSSACIVFSISGLGVRIQVPLPGMDDFKYTETGRDRSDNQIQTAYEAAVRQRWRCLLLGIKAKLECVESGISTIETEFMPFMVMPNGQTMAQTVIPQLEEAVKNGKMPKALPFLGGDS